MSSRFVSGGTISTNSEAAGDGKSTETTTSSGAVTAPPSKNNAEWEAVQAQLEAERQKREEKRRLAVEGGEKSLYDVLQENKAAKQAAFEEASKLTNQFRSLDDDEINFLDEVREKKRVEEEKVRKETEEGLKAFRQRQKGPEAPDTEAKQEGESEDWGVGRKRKRVKGKEVKGIVRRRVSEGEGDKEGDEGEKTEGKDELKQGKKPDGKAVDPTAKVEKKPAMGLVDYGSDDSD